MIRFIWRNLWRRKERIILTLVGVLTVSSGLGYLFGLSESNTGTVVDLLQKRWKASYHIVVRPPGTRGVTERKHLLEPNYLSGIGGGISLDQYKTIKGIDGVETAAPVAMIGYVPFQRYVEGHRIEKEGIYRVTKTKAVDHGIRVEKEKWHDYIVQGPWYSPLDFRETERVYGVSLIKDYPEKLMIGHSVLLAGIDPVQEARLVGLDRAVVSQGKSRYFDKDKVSITNGEILGKTYQRVEIPVLISNQSSSAVTYTWTIERLDLPFADEKTAAETMENVKRRGGKSYLDTLDAEGNPAVVSYGGRELFRQMAVDLTGIDPLTGKPAASEGERVSLTLLDQPIAKPSPLTYREAKSPFPDRWPLAYEVKPVPAEKGKEVVGFPLQSGSFRPFDYFTATLHFNYVGFFDPSKLNIAKDPLTELPMETYRPPSAKWVLDSKNRPVNPPKQLKPTDNPLGLLTQPPTMLTTLEAAQALVGDRPISAIRVKVSGVERLDEKSQARLEKIAAEIEKKTGLITDITLGSSPQPILLHVPAVGDLPELGWIEQPWVRIGSAITLFRETQLGYSGIVAGVIAVAAVYVLAMNGMSFLARRKEVAILLAVGWRPSQVTRMVLLEAGLWGLLAAIVSMAMLTFAHAQQGTAVPLDRLAAAGCLAMGLYLVGGFVTAVMAARVSPYETMRTGESDPVIRRWIAVSNRWTLAWSYFAGKWRRNLLSVLTIAIPSALFIFFVFVTIRLKGVFYTTWLGQYVSMQVGPAHYAAVGIAWMIAVLTTTEVLWQNVAERKPEIALLRSLGWRDGSIRFLMLSEGILCGLMAGIVGGAVSLFWINGIYGTVPWKDLAALSASGLIPAVVGLMGAVIPSEMAVRISPLRELNGAFVTEEKAERYLGMAVALVALGCLIGIMGVLILRW